MNPKRIASIIVIALAGFGLLSLFVRQGTFPQQNTDVAVNSGSIPVVKPRTTPQRVSQTNSTSAGDKEIIYMSVAERNDYFEILVKERPDLLLEQWLNLITNKSDVLRSQIIADALVVTLHAPSGGDDSVYSRLRVILEAPESTLQTRIAVISLLVDTATPNSLNILLSQVTSESNPEVKRALRFAIKDIGARRWGDRFHDELSPQLEKAIQGFETDPDFFIATIHSLAEVGAPTGIEAMYRYVNGMGTIPQRLPGQLDDPRNSLFADFMQIENPNAVIALKRHLVDQPKSDPELVVTGEALVSVANKDSTEVILEWAARRSDYVGSILEKWLTPLNEVDRLKVIIHDFTINQRFVNDLNRQAIARLFETK